MPPLPPPKKLLALDRSSFRSKTKISPRATRWCRSEQQLSGLRATIQCQQPDTDLYRFVGTLTRSDADADADDADVVESLNLDHVLLRGSRLKDTPYICGLHAP